MVVLYGKVCLVTMVLKIFNLIRIVLFNLWGSETFFFFLRFSSNMNLVFIIVLGISNVFPKVTGFTTVDQTKG